jgi:hypothetical protein
MVMVKANEDSESGAPPDTTMLEEMGRYNEELVKAGIMLDGEGLLPSSAGVRIQFSGDQRSVVDGPFAESKELIAGYVIIDVPSLDEAARWCTRYVTVVGTEEADVRELEDPPTL